MVVRAVPWRHKLLKHPAICSRQSRAGPPPSTAIYADGNPGAGGSRSLLARDHLSHWDFVTPIGSRVQRLPRRDAEHFGESWPRHTYRAGVAIVRRTTLLHTQSGNPLSRGNVGEQLPSHPFSVPFAVSKQPHAPQQASRSVGAHGTIPSLLNSPSPIRPSPSPGTAAQLTQRGKRSPFAKWPVAPSIFARLS
ncbi:hypothetical protein GQ53DRAFT_30874 [Thozetella sp. PMI_491]|nr:hypothetical protein GQ53DRAFT_30874 [Thozetella sp. PMI_491]